MLEKVCGGKPHSCEGGAASSSSGEGAVWMSELDDELFVEGRERE